MAEQSDWKDWKGLDCNETVHRLYHFLDGELTPDRRTQIVNHLDDCSPCLEAYDFEAELRRLIADKCRDHVPDRLRERIAQAIEHEHRSSVGNAVDGGFGDGGLSSASS